MALKYLKDIEVNIDNILIMAGDFNIRDSLWDSSFLHHSSISDDLMIIADSLNLTLSTPTNPSPTRFSDMAGEANSVIDLMFLRYGSSKLNQHSICPDHRLSSDHAPLIINIPIADEVINTSKLSIAPNSEQEKAFVKDLITVFKNIETNNIISKNNLEDIINCVGVVATTCQNGTRDILTSAKLSVGYLVVGITRELDKKPSLYCSSIYINTMWSVLQQCVYLMSYYSSTMCFP